MQAKLYLGMVEGAGEEEFCLGEVDLPLDLAVRVDLGPAGVGEAGRDDVAAELADAGQLGVRGPLVRHSRPSVPQSRPLPQEIVNVVLVRPEPNLPEKCK